MLDLSDWDRQMACTRSEYVLKKLSMAQQKILKIIRDDNEMFHVPHQVNYQPKKIYGIFSHLYHYIAR